jgi:uncharacterized membrane protein YhaH (DUF805 family)
MEAAPAVPWWRVWAVPGARVDRRTYLLSGLWLAALKYALDAALVYLVHGHAWTPLDYLGSHSPVGSIELRRLPWFVLLTTVPCVWIGLSLTLRRAVDAGLSPWIGFLFLVPYVNYALILALCIAPGRPPPPGEPARVRESSGVVASAVMATLVSLMLGIGVFAITVLAFETYFYSLFVTLPLVMGAVIGFWVNLRHDVTAWRTMGLGALALLGASLGLLVLGREGLVCIMMMLPLALPFGAIGALVGRELALLAYARVGAMDAGGLVVLLLVANVHDALTARSAPYSVATTVEIAAPPDVVWEHVVSFSELDEPPGFPFRAGIAYPLRARIEGSGVGAVRHCEFSTGAFVEPITAWEPPRRLAFDVVSQPPPMSELSPYRDLHPPHLDGYFRSQAGEFLLEPLPGGRTRLTGTTWYALDLQPAAYWSLWCDALVHAIHARVLRHVARLSEARAE